MDGKLNGRNCGDNFGILWCCRGRAVGDVVGRSPPFGGDRRMVRTTLVDGPVLAAASHHAVCFGSPYFFQARRYNLSTSLFFLYIIIKVTCICEI